jgi:hypothetical protein
MITARIDNSFILIAGKVVLVVLLTVSTARGGVLEKLFAPNAKLWERWTPHDQSDNTSIDHDSWGYFLKTYVSEHEDGINRIAYASVKKKDAKALSAYIAKLENTPVSRYNRDEQLAYWVNLYNALTVNVILDHYPVDSIRDIKISPGTFVIGPWSKKLISVEGEVLSLNDIEHRILRPIWRDPRIHYAVNCAAIGCPNLQREVFTAETADALLDTAARAYVNHQRGVRFENGRLIVSSIYSWFEEDFVDTDGSVARHLSRYADPDLAARLTDTIKVNGDEYDWTLNDATIP